MTASVVPRGPRDPGMRVEEPRSKGLPRPVKWAIQLLLTAGVTWLIVHRIGVSLDEALALGPAIPDPAAGWLLLSVLLLLTGFAFTATLWGRLVGELGSRNPGAWSSVRIVLAANLGRYLPGKLWQMAGLALLSRRAGVSATVGATAGVLGQTFALAAAAVLAIPVLLGPGLPAGRPGLWVIAALALCIAGASVPPLFRGGLRVIFRLARRSDADLPRTGPLFGPRWLGWHALSWVLYGAAFVVFVRGLGLPGNGLELAAAFAAAYLLGYIAFFAPAGIGVREGFLIAFLRPELGSAAVGVAVLTRIWMTVVELVPAGGLALWEILRGDRDARVDESVLEESRHEGRVDT